MFTFISRFFEKRNKERETAAAKKRELLLRNSLPLKWQEYQRFLDRWAAEGIYMLRQPTFEEWLFGNAPEVKIEVQNLLRGVGL